MFPHKMLFELNSLHYYQFPLNKITKKQNQNKTDPKYIVNSKSRVCKFLMFHSTVIDSFVQFQNI